MLVRSGESSVPARGLVMRSACRASLGIVCCEEYDVGVLTGMEKGLDVRGLVSRGAEGKPKGESCAETGDSVSVADCGGVKVNPPKAGLIPVGDM